MNIKRKEIEEAEEVDEVEEEGLRLSPRVGCVAGGAPLPPGVFVSFSKERGCGRPSVIVVKTGSLELRVESSELREKPKEGHTKAQTDIGEANPSRRLFAICGRGKCTASSFQRTAAAIS
jgi:hypothetical protein